MDVVVAYGVEVDSLDLGSVVDAIWAVGGGTFLSQRANRDGDVGAGEVTGKVGHDVQTRQWVAGESRHGDILRRLGEAVGLDA